MSVYFATCRKAKAVKIGCSLDPHDRLRELQRCCPLPVKIEAVLPGNHSEEGNLHHRFRDVRLHGEWFRITAEIEAIIAANPAPPPPTKAERLAVLRAEAASKRVLTPRQRERASWESEREKRLEQQHRWVERTLAKGGDIIFPFREKADA
jgi:Meiotically Up-regulated Gene 113 (MUG113) protein